MFNTSESTATGRKGSFGLKLGALVAASSLMLAGGVAVATSVYAAPNDNANSQGKKPDKDGGNNSGANNNPNAPGQNDNNGGAVGGDNGGGNGGGPGSGTGNPNNNSQNSDAGDGTTGTLRVAICHATRSYQNPYVYIVTDVSSVDELLRVVSGQGNGHGDHVGAIFDPATNRSGNNWGDIISRVEGANGKLYYPGYNLGNGGSELLANGCQFPKPTTTEIPLCVVKAPATTYTTEKFTIDNTGTDADKLAAAEKAAIADGYTVGTSSDCAPPCDPTTEICEPVCDPATESCEPVCDPATESCEETGTFRASDGAAFCEVTGDSYNGVQSVEVYNEPGTTQEIAQAKADARVKSTLEGKAKGDNIVPPHKAFAGYNWNEKTQARFAGGCSPNQSVLSVNAPAAGTTAPAKKPAAGNPAPGTVPVPAAGTPLPGSVPAGDGSSLPGLPVWALALLAVGAIGAAASGVSLATSRKG